MDPQSDFPDLVEDLEANIDDLETALSPLLTTPLHTTASILPLLDKAKLYVLSAYAIESLLFSTLQASDVNAKEHAVFRELARLKGYFGKIKDVEGAGAGAQQPKQRLDKEAAARFIKHGLAGNDKYDLERAERIAKERAKAALKARQMHVKFDQQQEEAKQAEMSKKRKAEEVLRQPDEQEDSEADHVESENEEFYGKPEQQAHEDTPNQLANKKPRVSASDLIDVEPPSTPAAPTPKSPKKSKKDKKRKHSTDATTATAADEEAEEQSTPQSKHERKAARRAKKEAKRFEKMQSLGGMRKNEELVLPERGQAPRTRSDTFNALLSGTFASQKKEETARKGKKK